MKMMHDYLITPDNQIYDPKTHDLKGVWNSKTISNTG